MKPPLTTEPEPYMEQSVSSGGAQPSAKAIFQQRKNFSKAAVSMGEISQYRVEHLATFSIERKEAILTVDDAIRKLQLLDARGKVWSQEIYLNVGDKFITLADCESLEELENFPLSTLQHIQSVIDACSYNNICALVIKEADQKTPDIHLFQCPNVPADVICADINSAFQDIKNKKGPKSRPDTLRRHRETIEASYQVPNSPINVKDRVAEWTNTIEAQNDLPVVSPRGSLNGTQDNPELIAFKITRDVEMLNHALDDIELFVSLLQKSAEATKELTVRQSKRSRKSSKRGKSKAPGSGLMELRARLPPKEQFIDCFQKFRFCFNLLAKLKSTIKEPNSVELVHFIFQPLGMIIHTCCGPELARTVRSPLLTKDTIDFLHNCVTTLELQLWQDLGDYWMKSKSDFPKDMYFPPYVPHFTSGWEPPPIPSMERDAGALAATIQEQADHVQRAEEAWKASGRHLTDALKPLNPGPPPEDKQVARSSSIYKPNGHDSSNAFKQHVQEHVARNQAAQAVPTPPRKLCRAMYDFGARNEHELSVRLDDLLDVLDDSKSWWKVQNEDGERGFVPGSMMLLISSAGKSAATSRNSYSPPPLPAPAPVPQPQKIPAAPSAPVYIPPPPAPVYIPPPPVPVYAPPPPAPVYAIPHAPPPPAPKLQPIVISSNKLQSVVLKKATPPQQQQRQPSIIADDFQKELDDRIQLQKPRHFVLPKKSTTPTALVINRSSTTREVTAWLQSLGFSSLTVDSLKVLNGAQLFTLTKQELRQICDNEGSRVYSQLMIQKSMNGFATTKSSSELGKIMMRMGKNISDETY